MAFPRSLANSITVIVMLKWKLEYNFIYLSRNVRPKIVMDSLNDWCKTTLYKKDGIATNSVQENIFNKSIEVQELIHYWT